MGLNCTSQWNCAGQLTKIHVLVDPLSSNTPIKGQRYFILDTLLQNPSGPCSTDMLFSDQLHSCTHCPGKHWYWPGNMMSFNKIFLTTIDSFRYRGILVRMNWTTGEEDTGHNRPFLQPCLNWEHSLYGCTCLYTHLGLKWEGSQNVSLSWNQLTQISKRTVILKHKCASQVGSAWGRLQSWASASFLPFPPQTISSSLFSHLKPTCACLLGNIFRNPCISSSRKFL